MSKAIKVYWSDRKGEAPPANARFTALPFLGGFEKWDSVERIETLPSPASVKVMSRSFSPSFQEWKEKIKRATDAIARKELQKVVLARSCTLELERAPDPLQIAAALRQRAEGAYVFCIQSETSAFLGATPERLFKRKGREILSEAMAGTRKRGKDAFEEALLRAELLSSAKDLREFNPVQEYLQTVLSPFCSSPLSFTPLSIHPTQNVQHLYSQCSGHLKTEIEDGQILTALHPTPALCGSPKEKALSWIHELEPFQRGLYGGVIGWETPEQSEWIVAIRSCLLEGNRATLFSGLGIVDGSNAEEEWDELNQKLKLYDGIFT